MDWALGRSMMVMGMVVTLLTLIILGFVIRLWDKMFRYKEEKKTKG